MLIFNGTEIQLNSRFSDVNAHRLLSQARLGLNVFLATGAENEASWADFLLRVSAQLPTLRVVGLVPPSIYGPLALTHGNVPVLAVPEGLLREAAEARRREEPIRLHLIWVASSKGGMGKSTFSVLLANQWATRGMAVKVVDQDAISTLGTVLRSLTGSEAGSRLGLRAQGEVFLAEREPGKPERIFLCPPSRPESSAMGPWDRERMVLDALLAAAVLLPGDRVVIDLPGDVGMAVERLKAVATMMEVTGARLRRLDIYLFIQPQEELMGQAFEAIQRIGRQAEEMLKRLCEDNPEAAKSDGPIARLTVLYPYNAGRQDIWHANRYLAAQPELHQMAMQMGVFLASDPVGQLPSQWKYWETVMDPKPTSLVRVDSIRTVPVQSIQEGGRGR